jgi:5-methylcytosine-specific restriction endonuclease McrA
LTKLKQLSSRLTALPPRIGHNSRAAAERDRNRRRAHESVWRKWYHLARWKKHLRPAILERDDWTCQRTGVLLIGPADAPDSPVVHHIIPHDGDPDLFWDPNNLQAVSKEWHDSEGQKDDTRYRGAKKARPNRRTT